MKTSIGWILLTSGLLILAASCKDHIQGTSESQSQKQEKKTNHMYTEDLDLAHLLTAFPPPREGEKPSTMEEVTGFLKRYQKAMTPTAPWLLQAPLWFGRGIQVNADPTYSECFLFLRLRHSGPTAAPVFHGFARTLEPDGFAEDEAADNLLEALEKGTPVPKQNENAAYAYMYQLPEPKGIGQLLPTTGISLRLAARHPTYLRAEKDRLLLVQKNSPISPVRKTPYDGAGIYGELWPVLVK